LVKATRILRNIDGIAHVELDEADVVRHRLVKHIIRAYDKEQAKEEQRHEEHAKLKEQKQHES